MLAGVLKQLDATWTNGMALRAPLALVTQLPGVQTGGFSRPGFPQKALTLTTHATKTPLLRVKRALSHPGLCLRTCPNHRRSVTRANPRSTRLNPVWNKPSSHPGHYQDRVVHNGSHFGVMRQHLIEMWGGCNEWPHNERVGNVARRLLLLLAPSSS